MILGWRAGQLGDAASKLSARAGLLQAAEKPKMQKCQNPRRAPGAARGDLGTHDPGYARFLCASGSDPTAACGVEERRNSAR